MSPVTTVRPFLVLGAVLAQFLPAQQPQETKPPAAEAPKVVKATDAPVTVALGQQFTLAAGEHNLAELVEQAATVLGRNILWKANEMSVNGGAGLSVTLNNPVKLTPPAFEELLTSLLYTQGFAIVPLDATKGFYEVISLNGPRNREVSSRAVWRTPDEVLARPNHREYVVTSVRLKYINAVVCTNALRPFFASNGGPQGGGQMTLGNVGNLEGLVLAGFTDQICSALRLIRECDVEPTQLPDPMMMQQNGQNPFAPMQAQIKALQEQVAELQKAAGIPVKEKKEK